tara:strand:+ start:1090 stop:2502 length:1413 start_codon:yes stop_codon:yes gene_type:complete
MRQRDTQDVMMSAAAVICDGLFVFGGFLLAIWIRFDSGWIPVIHGRMPNLYEEYAPAGAIAALAFLIINKSLGLYIRPQTGAFGTKIPRLTRGIGLGIIAMTVIAFAAKNVLEISTGVLIISFFTIMLLVLVERFILFRLEIVLAKRNSATNQVLILGTDETASHLMKGIDREPRLRSQVMGFLKVDACPAHDEIPAEKILGSMADLQKHLESGSVGQVVLTRSDLGHNRIIDIIILCERSMTQFNMVPDLFQVMTGSIDVQTIDDIPLLGVRHWPLDLFWNRILKRTEDITCAIAGLILAAPVIALAAIFVKRSSPGPVFYRQERCGEAGQVFTIYKLRTMPVDSESESGPVWATDGDQRRTPVGAFLRENNIDELPQLWNVLTGNMSLVGPRPERPHFVEQFKDDIARYMWRHMSKPGITGWAQVNGLRGNTSLTERIKYDLYYLENWSVSFDFKIITRTIFARKNAY